MIHNQLTEIEDEILRKGWGPSTEARLRAAAEHIRTAQGITLPPTERRAYLYDRLRRQLTEMQQQQSQVAVCWDSRQRKLAERLLRQPADDFLRWPETRFMQSFRHGEAQSLLSLIRQDARWSERWSRLITENQVGRAWQLSGEAAYSPNSVLLTSHLWRYEGISNLLIEKSFDTIVEFGGGYGAMCRIIHELGFKGKYVIFDLPVMSALQNYYLGSVGLPVIFPGKLIETANSGIACISSSDELRQILGAKATDSSDQSTRVPRSLFLANWSFSETPIEFREQFHDIISKFSAYLISYQIAFEGCDNRRYFHELISEASLSDLSWIEQRLKSQPLNYYLFGFQHQTSQVVRELLQENMLERIAKHLLLWLKWNLL